MKIQEERYRKIDEYLVRMLEENKNINLTNIRDHDEAVILHIEDSLLGYDLFSRYCTGNYADIGSGCGFPGVALAIAGNHDVDLVDSLAKKMKAVAKALSGVETGININTLSTRIEDLANARPGHYQFITARALTALPSLIELASPLLETGGYLLAYKSEKIDEEFEQAMQIQELVGMEHVSTSDVELAGAPRKLVLFKKANEPEIVLPRRNGMAQKRPLKRKQ